MEANVFHKFTAVTILGCSLEKEVGRTAYPRETGTFADAD